MNIMLGRCLNIGAIAGDVCIQSIYWKFVTFDGTFGKFICKLHENFGFSAELNRNILLINPLADIGIYLFDLLVSYMVICGKYNRRYAHIRNCIL